MNRFFAILLAATFLCGCQVKSPTVTVPSIDTEPTTSTTMDSSSPEDISVANLLNTMTTAQKVGQLFLARCPASEAVDTIAKYQPGGYILFAQDFAGETPDSVRQTLSSYQTAAITPMLFAVDEEGGKVNRVSCHSAFRREPFDSPRNLYLAGGFEKIRQTEAEKCTLLQSLGLNVNVAPVCDITTDPTAFLYSRSLGQSPEVTAQFIQTVVSVQNSYALGGILKHFPGYGNNADTHNGIAVDKRPLVDLEKSDLIPFAAGIAAGCDAIMVSHIYVQALDSDFPASLSPAVHQYLRRNMGFSGVIVTDDLVMGAIGQVYDPAESAVLAVLAGNDLLCVTDLAVQYDAVLTAVENGRISEEILNAAVTRVLNWKHKLGLL